MPFDRRTGADTVVSSAVRLYDRLERFESGGNGTARRRSCVEDSPPLHQPSLKRTWCVIRRPSNVPTMRPHCGQYVVGIEVGVIDRPARVTRSSSGHAGRSGRTAGGWLCGANPKGGVVGTCAKDFITPIGEGPKPILAIARRARPVAYPVQSCSITAYRQRPVGYSVPQSGDLTMTESGEAGVTLRWHPLPMGQPAGCGSRRPTYGRDSRRGDRGCGAAVTAWRRPSRGQSAVVLFAIGCLLTATGVSLYAIAAGRCPE